jgi:hypothetical protein
VGVHRGGEPAADGSSVENVTLIARAERGVTLTTVVGLGNDAPVATPIDPPPAASTLPGIEASGIALLRFLGRGHERPARRRPG